MPSIFQKYLVSKGFIRFLPGNQKDYGEKYNFLSYKMVFTLNLDTLHFISNPFIYHVK